MYSKQTIECVPLLYQIVHFQNNSFIKHIKDIPPNVNEYSGYKVHIRNLPKVKSLFHWTSFQHKLIKQLAETAMDTRLNKKHDKLYLTESSGKLINCEVKKNRNYV